MSDATVTLREHLELQVRHERELRLLTDEKADLALRLQATEYERRLDVLNHEHARTAAVLTTTLPRELFDEYAKGITDHLARIDRTIALVTGGLVVIELALRVVGPALLR